MEREASTTIDRSGSLVLLRGVGTQMISASHSPSESKSQDAERRPAFTSDATRSGGTSPTWERPALTLPTFSALKS